MSKLKRALQLFLVFFKIGLFTFGGGYAMIAVIEREIVEKRKWITHEDFLDLIGVAESTPGPLAINSATYIGYKHVGVLGSIFSTLGVVLPSFVIILTISFFFDAFLQYKWVVYAFRGIQSCVAFLIVNASIKMVKHLKLNWFNATLFIVTVIAMVVLDLFAMNVSSIIYILIGGVLGVCLFLCSYFKRREDKKTKEEDKL